jgi:RNA polymerase sigma-70 factor (ECF subfamily)
MTEKKVVTEIARRETISSEVNRMYQDQTADNFAPAAVAESPPSPREPTDDELVAEARAGDEAAFAILFKRHRRLVTGLAYRFFYRREQVEEMVQESFAEAYFALGAYRGGHERSFVAWLSRITVRACYSEMQRSKRRSESALGDFSEEELASLADRSPGNGGEADVESAVISRDLASKLLGRLDADDRLALTLLNLADFSVAETAEVTGWSVSKVKMRASRARAALRRALHRFL